MKQSSRGLRAWFSRGELALWGGSVILLLTAFFYFDRNNYWTLAASLIGITSLLLCAKGNPIGQLLMFLFSGLYGYISYTFAYYGEMITYLGMTAPMAALSVISWLRHPYPGGRAEVEVNRLSLLEGFGMLLLTAGVTWGGYFLLAAFRTANLPLSTLSVATSFLAAYLTFRRSAYFALAYGINDLVLVALWMMAAQTDPAYWSVAVCFSLFFLHDLYGFSCWLSMRRRQEQSPRL